MKTKLKAANFSNLSFSDYKKEFLRLLKLAPYECPNAEKALWIFIYEKHTFTDPTEHPFVILCKKATAWDAIAKKLIKSDKKHTLVGKAYFHRSPKGKTTLQVEALNGSAKVDKINKAAKALFNKANIELVLAKGAPKVATKKEESPKPQEEQNATPNNASDSPEIAQKKEKAKETFSTFSSLMKKLGIQV